MFQKCVPISLPSLSDFHETRCKEDDNECCHCITGAWNFWIDQGIKREMVIFNSNPFICQDYVDHFKDEIRVAVNKELWRSKENRNKANILKISHKVAAYARGRRNNLMYHFINPAFVEILEQHIGLFDIGAFEGEKLRFWVTEQAFAQLEKIYFPTSPKNEATYYARNLCEQLMHYWMSSSQTEKNEILQLRHNASHIDETGH
jgi:hypothetical protein